MKDNRISFTKEERYALILLLQKAKAETTLQYGVVKVGQMKIQNLINKIEKTA